MPELSKGANAPITAQQLEVRLSWATGPRDDDVDVAALLLDKSGRVRDDSDFVFFNQPNHRSGAVCHVGRTLGARVMDKLTVDLGRIEPAVDRIVLIASVSAGDLSEVAGVQLELAARTMESIGYAVSGTSTEAALIAGEIYRRAEQWKFRAVGQGYDSGLAGVATDFGITVDEDPVVEVAVPVQRLSTPVIVQQPQSVQPAPLEYSTAPLSPSTPQPVASTVNTMAPTQIDGTPWYKVKADYSVDFLTRVPLGEVAQTFKGVIRSKSRKAEFDAVQQINDPFDQFNDNADFAAVAKALELTKWWALQIYVYELENGTGVTLRAIGDNGFSRALNGRNSFSRTAGKKKGEAVIHALKQRDPSLEWLRD